MKQNLSAEQAMERAYAVVLAQVKHAETKHPDFESNDDRVAAVLLEEMGEVAQAFCDDRDNLGLEMAQCGAVVSRMMGRTANVQASKVVEANKDKIMAFRPKSLHGAGEFQVWLDHGATSMNSGSVSRPRFLRDCICYLAYEIMHHGLPCLTTGTQTILEPEDAE